MSPLERAARALYKKIGSDFDPFSEGEDAKWPEFVDTARAVLEAIREPSEGMVLSVDEAANGHGEYIWQAMIDAALADGE